MNRKYKFPCAHTHYHSNPKDENGKMVFWSEEELAQMYDPHCVDCRETYKMPGNNALFYPHWWAYTYKPDLWIFKKGYYDGKSPWFIGMWKRFGFWSTLKYAFWGRSHYDQYQSLRLPFLSVHWAPIGFRDIQECWVDLSRYYPAPPIKDEKWKEYNATTQHLIRVAYRFQRMWEVELKLKKKYCDFNGRKDGKCEYGTYGCETPHSLDFLDSVKQHRELLKQLEK